MAEAWPKPMRKALLALLGWAVLLLKRHCDLAY